ncbi:hypothetical protein M409DRAFT_37425 [Zasmidium cellare ATCC 36951]|uniref:Major facilitator superfamily (MFS) profile domain-containing protein n=1 Tax=Zasmidium cellare ATCC 36951 TaxID=1080233 RepID=A0A6A6C801_ZASCE|nr:uncharacterized protein M409DRAFT_37425 [Zasmidium cellare ATCC 36951]KAF2162368.1 hypothetical protein M409DRAFT_37425 [Zasmidium cellare ATCC 36951]
MIMSSFCIGGALVSIDSVIVSVALPTIADTLNMNSAEYSWIESAYLLAGAATMPACEPVSDSVGRKLVLAFGLTLFLLGSILAALARHPSLLIAGRTVQGIGEGAFTVMANVCFADLFSLSERGLYIAMYAGASCLGAALAPLIGAALTRGPGWRWCFWIALPFTTIALVLALIFLPFPLAKSPKPQDLRRIDVWGILLVTSCTVLLLLGLQFGGIFLPWQSAVVISLLSVGGAVLLVFICQIFWRHPARPLMPLHLFRNRTGVACLSISFFHGFTYLTVLYYVPLYMQLVLEIGLIRIGCLLLTTAVPTTIFTILAALIIRKTGRYARVIQTSTAFMAFALGLSITLPAYRSWPRLILFQLILAVGVGPLFQAPLIGLQAAVSKDEGASAYAVAIFLRTIASTIGLVVGQVVISNGIKQKASLLVAAGIPEDLVRRLQRDVSTLVQFGKLGRLGAQTQQVALKSAVTFSLSRVWVVCTAVAAAGLVASLLIEDLPLSRDTPMEESESGS